MTGKFGKAFPSMSCLTMESTAQQSEIALKTILS